MMLTVFITQVWQYLFICFRLPVASIATHPAFNDFTTYYSISLTLPSRAHLSPSASLFSPSKKGNDLLLAPDSTTKCQLAPPQRLCDVPVPVAVPSTWLLCQTAHSCCDRHNRPLQPPNHPPSAHAPTPNRQVPLPAARSTGPVATRCRFTGLLPGASLTRPPSKRASRALAR